MSAPAETIEPRFVELIPEELEEGVLYVSREYQTATHLCACGCRSRVVTPLGPLGWALTEREAGVSLRPSIGNSNFPCRSHYWIREGRVEWAAPLTDRSIAASRQRDQRAKERYFAERRHGRVRGWLPKLRETLLALFRAGSR